jgi:hypothetical protein
VKGIKLMLGGCQMDSKVPNWRQEEPNNVTVFSTSKMFFSFCQVFDSLQIPALKTTLVLLFLLFKFNSAAIPGWA